MKAIALGVRSPLCLLLISLSFLLVCFAPCQMARAISPAPDGGYAGNNTAEGTSALFSLTSGADNTAIGFQALFHNTSGTFNSGEGFRALFSNTTGMFNTATGVQALNSNTIGAQNTATGVNALFSNTTASFNTANGTSALFHNTTGSQNTATGVNALTNNTTGNANTANGVNTLFRNTTGDSNTATGVQALFNNTTGANNVAVGRGAGNGLETGSGNSFIGSFAGANEASSVDDVICLGTLGDTQLAGQITPNRCYIGNIVGVSTGGPSPSVNVIIDQDGQLGTVVSSSRFKKDIKPMEQASEGILKLKPVTFHYKDRDNKNDNTPQFGLIAEDVEQVNRDLVVYGKDGKVLSVRYDAVDVMLLNEFLKEHEKVEEQEANIAELKSTVAQQQKGIQVLTAQLKEQASQIQNVRAQLELNKRALRTVANK